MIRLLLRNLLCLLLPCLLVLGVSARAEPPGASCPESFPAEAPNETATRNSELDRLAALAVTCLQSAQFYAYQGQLLLMQERYVDALVALERSLLLDSAKPGVQLDYVVALSKTGNQESARALANQVLERDDMPPSVRASLEGVLRERATSDKADDARRWLWRGSLSSLVGVESNLNSATSADAISLTLPNGNISLMLDGTSKPRSGSAWLNIGSVTGQSALDKGSLVFQADWRERVAPGNGELGYRQQDASLLFRPNNANGWIPRIAVSNFSMDGSTLFTGLTATAWREYSGDILSRSLSSCIYRAGLEGERRTYTQDNTQNGFYGSVLTSLVCLQGDNLYQWGIQTGRDWASTLRAGGDQTRLDLKALWERQWQFGRTTAEWMMSGLQDASPYSKLLGGVTRTTLRQNARFTLTKRLEYSSRGASWGSLYSVTNFEIFRHTSNLELFDIKGESFYTGLRYEF